MSVLDATIGKNTKYDLFIGLESINAIAGVVLKIGLVKTVYIMFLITPFQIQIGWFNKLYLWFDRLTIAHVDYIWDVSL